MLLLWLATWALNVTPQLHLLLHNDAQSPDHNCLITQLQHHSVLTGIAPVVVPTATTDWSEPAGCPEFQLFGSFDYRLSPSRAPPAA